MNCPTCSSPLTLNLGPGHPVSASLPDALFAADEDERIETTRVCWDCGWQETRQMRVDSIDVTEGDDVAGERAALIDGITEEIEAMEDLATLEDILAEIRHQRRLESVTPEADDSAE